MLRTNRQPTKTERRQLVARGALVHHHAKTRLDPALEARPVMG